MTYKKLNDLLKNHSEIHYITDSDIFFDENNIDINKYKTDTTFLNWIGKYKLTINNNLSINIKNKKNVSNLHVYSHAKKHFFCLN